MHLPIAITAFAVFLCRPAISQQVPLHSSNGISPQDTDQWIAQTTSFQPNNYQNRPYVANGYFGQSLPAEGHGYWIDRNETTGGYAKNGWPLDQPRATFGTITGFWGLIPKVTRPILDDNVRRGWESVISGIPDWTSMEVSVDGHYYRPGVNSTTIESYSQSQSLRNGIVQTNVTWRPTADMSRAFRLNYTVLAHRKRMNLGLVILDMESSDDVTVTVTDILDGNGASRSLPHTRGITEDDDLMWTSVRPVGVENVTAYIVSSVTSEFCERTSERAWPIDDLVSDIRQDNITISQRWSIILKAGKTVRIIKYIGVASSETFENPRDTATDAVLQAKGMTWQNLLREHDDEWTCVWDGSDVVVKGNEQVTKLLRSSLFHLFSNARAGFNTSLTVSGLSSDSYAGLIFWDTDTWMFPAFLLFKPEYARNIVQYRRSLLDQAVRNSQLYNYSGALYPWTSARYGNCTGTGLCQHYQYHLNTDIALSAWQYYQHTLDLSWLRDTGWPVIEKVSQMFAGFVRKNDTRGGKYETIRMGEPDEYVWNVNNGAFTNAGIKQLLGDWAPSAAAQLGLSPPSNWSTIANNIVIPYDEKENLVHEFDNMLGTIKVKQASVALLNFPLNYRINPQQARNDLEFYGPITSPDGPAMTWSIFAISSSQLQESGCAAYTYFVQSYEPYLREPFYQLSEQIEDDPRLNGGISPAFPFLTGHGGLLQIITHGLVGFRSGLDALVLDPMLPPQMPSGVQVKGMKWQGAVFDIDIQPVQTSIIRRSGGSRGPVIVRVGNIQNGTRDFEMLVGDYLNVPTRRPDLQVPAVEGNLVQCSRATSNTSHVPGHGPIGAVDGSVVTVWQPTFPGDPAELTIHIKRQSVVHGFYLNWANSPPQSFSISLGRSEDGDVNNVFSENNVTISTPYKGPEDAKKVKLRKGNTTSHTFDSPYVDVRFFKLIINGTQGLNQGVGATVAEIVVF